MSTHPDTMLHSAKIWWTDSSNVSLYDTYNALAIPSLLALDLKLSLACNESLEFFRKVRKKPKVFNLNSVALPRSSLEVVSPIMLLNREFRSQKIKNRTYKICSEYVQATNLFSWLRDTKIHWSEKSFSKQSTFYLLLNPLTIINVPGAVAVVAEHPPGWCQRQPKTDFNTYTNCPVISSI